MAGGLAFETPFGTLYSTNITPDADTGIGNWSDWDFLNAMRHGVRPNNEHLYPAFPYTAFTKISNEDIAAIYAYLQRIPPVDQAAPVNELSFPFNIRPLMAFWKAIYFEQGVFKPNEEQSDEWNRGAYLVEGLAHCSVCHTPRNGLGAEQKKLRMSGGEYLDRIRTGAHRPWAAPNLTSTERGLGLWTQQEIEDYLKTARNEFLESFGPMNEVIMNSTRFLSTVMSMPWRSTSRVCLLSTSPLQKSQIRNLWVGAGLSTISTAAPAIFQLARVIPRWRQDSMQVVWLCNPRIRRP